MPSAKYKARVSQFQKAIEIAEAVIGASTTEPRTETKELLDPVKAELSGYSERPQWGARPSVGALRG